ncbi:hypothetical protein KAR26_02785 [Candidatus Parcubacteria bacterium]|nr:hypothetical protein [Candidatus Parcubacteria bacterium]
MTIQQFIKKRKYLVWYVKNPEKLDNDAIVEAVLNYGNWDDVQKMLKILGIEKTAEIFRKKSKQKRCNYLPDIKNYFNLYFNKYAK